MFLPRKIIENKLLEFLKEDLGHGDITTSILIPENVKVKAEIIAKEPGIIAGIEEAKILLESLGIKTEVKIKDGQKTSGEKTILKLEGNARLVPGYLNMGVGLNLDADQATPGDDFVRITDVAEVDIDKQLTIAMWAKGTNFAAYRTLLSKTDGGAYALTVENGVPTAWIHIQGDYLHVTGKSKLQKDVWYHLAVTFDGSDAIIYLDGEKEAKGSRKGNITINTSDVMIGAEPAGKKIDHSYPAWHGILDEFYLYDRALAKEEIAMLIKRGSPVEHSGKLSVLWAELKASLGALYQ